MTQSLQDVPDSFDWRSHGFVSPVTNQGPNGSPDVDAVVSSAEGSLAQETGTLTLLSRQQLLDCVKPSAVLVNIYASLKKSGGIESAKDYPDGGSGLDCNFDASKILASYSGYSTLNSGDEENLKRNVATNGQYVVQVDANADFIFYQSGIFDSDTCMTTEPDHALVVVGYGVENGVDFWALKNSWGVGWGEKGFMRLARNKGNLCGVATYPSLPIVKSV